MSSRLTIDLGALASTGSQLARIAAEFDTADLAVERLTAAIGSTHDTHELRAAVEDFVGNWRIRREGMQGNLVYLADVATAVADNLSGADADLAASLDGSSSGTAAPQHGRAA